MCHGTKEFTAVLTTFYKGESKYTNRLLTIAHLGLLFLALGFSLEPCIRNGFALVILNSHVSNISQKYFCDCNFDVLNTRNLDFNVRNITRLSFEVSSCSLLETLFERERFCQEGRLIFKE